MELHFRKTGTGSPLIILHGLFGMGDNWATMSRYYAEQGYAAYLIDLRNHGRSPHSDEFNYEVMVEDLHEFVNKHGLNKCSIIGHSMGGKVAMLFAAKYGEMVDKLIVVDIGSKYYPPHHQVVLSAMHAVRPRELSGRKEAEETLRETLKEEDTIQFFLKNLYWNQEEKLDWRFNLKGIELNIEEVGKSLSPEYIISTPALFVSGERSGYILKEDQENIREQFTDVKFVTILNAGHWVHAENPKDFFEETLSFLKNA